MSDVDAVTDVVMDASRALVGVAAWSIADVSDEVSLPQYRALVVIDSRSSIPMGDLAQALGVNPSTATRVCDVLAEKGLVSRAPRAGNRRIIDASLTEKGRKLVSRSLRRRRKRLETAVARLSPDARRRLGQTLAEFTDVLGEVSAHAWALGWPSTDEIPEAPR